VKFSYEQLEKLSDFCIDVAKGLFLAALAIPIIAPALTVYTSYRMLVTGLFFIYLSMKLIEGKESKYGH